MARRPAPTEDTVTEEDAEHQSDLVDEALAETFPASDPPAQWAGPDRDPEEEDTSH